MSTLSQKFNCPCCNFPTLEERGGYDICVICWWEDDGQDDPNASEIWGGPNGWYSLTRARVNFMRHGNMYSAGEGIDAVEKPTSERQELLNYIAEVKFNSSAANTEILTKLINKID